MVNQTKLKMTITQYQFYFHLFIFIHIRYKDACIYGNYVPKENPTRTYNICSPICDFAERKARLFYLYLLVESNSVTYENIGLLIGQASMHLFGTSRCKQWTEQKRESRSLESFKIQKQSMCRQKANAV